MLSHVRRPRFRCGAVQYGERSLWAVHDQSIQVLPADVGRQLRRRELGLAPESVQEDGDAEGLLLDKGPQRARGQGGSHGEIIARHEARPHSQLQRSRDVLVRRQALPLELLQHPRAQIRQQLDCACLKGEVQGPHALQVFGVLSPHLHQKAHHRLGPSRPLGKDRRMQHVVVHLEVSAHVGTQAGPVLQKDPHHVDVASARRQMDGLAAALLLSALELGLVGEAPAHAPAVCLQ
mmetsp:Transcript_105139/g.263336  ORF Transcript_105139/g.263336 Transcript_105139/m.263336 type:complete len:235 (+) Transcript_105139:1680-2384(+)